MRPAAAPPVDRRWPTAFRFRRGRDTGVPVSPAASPPRDGSRGRPGPRGGDGLALPLHPHGAPRMVSHLDPTTAGLVGLFVIPALGCLFTNPINMPPTVSIIEQSPHIWHHQDAQFTAEASDPDGDPVR